MKHIYQKNYNRKTQNDAKYIKGHERFENDKHKSFIIEKYEKTWRNLHHHVANLG